MIQKMPVSAAFDTQILYVHSVPSDSNIQEGLLQSTKLLWWF